MVNRKNNKNVRFVRVRTPHQCKHCGIIIAKGTECLTVNKKLSGRQWVCEECIEHYLNYREALARRDSVAFGDEGAAMAMQDIVSDYETILYERGFFD